MEKILTQNESVAAMAKVAIAPRRPESVLVVVHTAALEVLLLKRREPFSFWQSVTGSLAGDECHASAAARELLEETGFGTEGALMDTGVCREFTIDPRWVSRYAAGVTTNREHAWTYCLPSQRDVALCAAEHTEYCWVALDKAIDMVWSWTNKEALQSLRNEQL